MFYSIIVIDFGKVSLSPPPKSKLEESEFYTLHIPLSLIQFFGVCADPTQTKMGASLLFAKHVFCQ